MSTRKRTRPRAPAPRPGPAGGKRDTNRKRRTEALLAAGLELFLARGIESVTIDEIVAKADTAKGSFYRYFADKDALVDAIFAPLRDHVSQAFVECETALRAADSRETLVAAYRILAERLGEGIVGHAGAALLYLQESRGPARGARSAARLLADRIDARALELTHVAHDRGLLRPFDGRVSALAVVGAGEKLLFALLSGRDLGDPREIPMKLVSLVLEGLRPSS